MGTTSDFYRDLWRKWTTPKDKSQKATRPRRRLRKTRNAGADSGVPATLAHPDPSEQNVRARQQYAASVADGPHYVAEDDGQVRKVSGPSATNGNMGGGRVTILVARFALVAIFAVIVINGVLRIAESDSADAAGDNNNSADDAVGAYAEAFMSDYLTFDGNTPDEREDRLARYGLSDVDVWNGTGTQSVRDIVTAESTPIGDDTSRVTVAAKVEPGGWMCYQVAVYDGGKGSFAITSTPAAVQCPPAAQPDVDGLESLTAEADMALVDDLDQLVRSFLPAYAKSSDDLVQFITNDSNITGLGGTQEVHEIGELLVPAIDEVTGNSATQRHVYVTVTWNMPSGGQLDQTYDVTVEQGDVSGSPRWFVSRIVGGVPDGSYVADSEESPDAEPTEVPSPTTDESTTSSPEPDSDDTKQQDKNTEKKKSSGKKADDTNKPKKKTGNKQQGKKKTAQGGNQHNKQGKAKKSN